MRTLRRLLTGFVLGCGMAADADPLRLVAAPLLTPVATAWAASLPAAERRTANALTAVQALIHGRADAIAIARPLTPAEKRLVPGPLRSLPVGIDGVAVYARRTTVPAPLSLGVLERLFFGGNRCHPPAPPAPPRHRFGLTAAAARHFQFVHRIGCGHALAEGVRTLPRDRDVVAAVAATPDAIGFASASLIPPPAVRILGLQRRPGDPVVFPDRSALRQGRYPLTHYLYLHLRPGHAGTTLARHALSPAGQRILTRHRFVALPEPLRRRALARLTAVQ